MTREQLREFDPTSRLRVALEFCSERQLRLFAFAVARCVAEPEWADQVLDAANHLAEGTEPTCDLAMVLETIWDIAGETSSFSSRTIQCVEAACNADTELAARSSLEIAIDDLSWGEWHRRGGPNGKTGPIHISQADFAPCLSHAHTTLNGLIDDIFGNPVHRIYIDPSWRTSTAVAIAKGMYDSRNFAAMPLLADALQDAGCADERILDHCRGPGSHVRGCWVVDLVLGKA